MPDDREHEERDHRGEVDRLRDRVEQLERKVEHLDRRLDDLRDRPDEDREALHDIKLCLEETGNKRLSVFLKTMVLAEYASFETLLQLA